MAEDNENIVIPLVNHEPEVVYMRLEEKLLNGLPADQPGFIKLLANEGIIGEKARKKMNMPNKTRASCAAAVLHEFNTSPFPNEKFYKLLSVMKQYKHGMEILAEEIETHLDPVSGPFDCRAMGEYLSKNRYSLENLPYHKMKHLLTTFGVITNDEKRVIDQYRDQMFTVLNKIIPKVYDKQPKNFKSFLQAMEQSGVPLLEDTAKRLGGSKRVPETPQDFPRRVLNTAEGLTSEKFIEKYLKAKHDLGSAKVKLLKVLLFGPAGAGKTTLFSVLLQQDIESLRESTGILDQKFVQFKVAVERGTTRSVSQWKIVSTNEEILRLRNIIEKNIKERTKKDTNLDVTSLKKQSLCSSGSPYDIQPNMKIDEKLQTVVKNVSAVQPEITENKNMSKMKLQEQFTTNDTLIACYDSGGQPEIFDVMPTLATITTGNVMVFDMSKDLNLPLDSNFFKGGNHWRSSDIKTHYTTAQLLKTALANIQSCAIPHSSRSATNISAKNSRLLVVGTHLDLCGDTEDKVFERLLEFEKIICDQVLPECSNISIVERQKSKITRIIHPIANKCDENNIKAVNDREEAAQEIRTAIENMSVIDNANKEIPVSWLLFQYEIKLQSTGPCILRSNCDEIAEKSYIKQEDIDDVLFFFHELGVLLYYRNIEKLSHVVISDPQWLFNQLTKIIELKYNPSYDAEKSIKRGIFKKRFLAEVYDKEFDSNSVIKYEDFLSLFIHLNIMAKLSDTPEQYFMPALLDPAPTGICESVAKAYGSKVFSTLFIRFKSGFIPRGVFCCLITLSVQNNRTWKLQNNAAYKNLVVFQIESNKEYLILFDRINYISVEFHQKEDLLSNSHQVLCYKLSESLKEVCTKIHLNGEFEFGFLCENCQSTEIFAGVQMEHPCYSDSLLCATCQHNPKMTYEQLVWFFPPTIADMLNEMQQKSSVPSLHAVQYHTKRELSDTQSDSGEDDHLMSSRMLKKERMDKIALCRDSFSASFAWNLKRLHNIKLDGTGTVIVILDTAVDLDYIGKQIDCFDFLPDIQLKSCDHGTFCSSIAVGAPLSTNLPRGVAPGANLIVYRIAEGSHYSTEAILTALEDLQNKVEEGTAQVDVISMSFECDENYEREIEGKIEILTKMGIVCVAAAGNRGSYQPHSSIPARFDSVISVGALDQNGRKAPFTAQGRVDVYAPGEDIEFSGVKYWGTSFATPAVGGLILLLKQWANYIGSPASDSIYRVEILRKIFQKDMFVKSDNGEDNIFTPVEFFMSMKDNPTKLNDIVQKYLDEETIDMEQ